MLLFFYNSIIQDLYIVLCVPHSRSSLLPSPFLPLHPPLPSPTHLSFSSWQKNDTTHTPYTGPVSGGYFGETHQHSAFVRP